ncbi:MAG: DUF6165 family protein [Steroidobacteraceae bacterium]
MKELLVPVSPGELLDKITILRIKAMRITDTDKLANVRHELQLLERTWHGAGNSGDSLAKEAAALQRVNERLWDIEDRLRELEARRDFGPAFVELARAVYVTNDERAAIKRRINTALGSVIVEEKSYQAY